MLSLIWKIGADTNPFRKAIKEVPEEAKKAGKEAGGAFGKELGQQAKSALMQFVGAGAILGIFRKAFDEAGKIAQEQAKTGLGSREVQVLARASERTGLSQEEIVQRGKANPQAFANLIKSIESEGGFLTDENIASLNRGRNAAEGFKRGASQVASSALDYGAKGLEALTYGAFAGAGSGAGLLGRLTGSQMLKDIEREYMTRAEVGAESLVGGRVGASQSTNQREVADAIRALHATVIEKL